MAGWTKMQMIVLAGVLAGAAGLPAPAHAEGFVQSLFNSGQNNSGAKPLFLNRGNGSSKEAPGRVFDMNAGNKGGNRPSVAGFGPDTQARNDAAINANVARSMQAAAAAAVRQKEINKKQEEARYAASAGQGPGNTQTAAAPSSPPPAEPPPVGATSAPAVETETPLYNTPGQASTGQAPIFGVH